MNLHWTKEWLARKAANVPAISELIVCKMWKPRLDVSRPGTRIALPHLPTVQRGSLRWLAVITADVSACNEENAGTRVVTAAVGVYTAQLLPPFTLTVITAYNSGVIRPTASACSVAYQINISKSSEGC
jgi:hypothetical protein